MRVKVDFGVQCILLIFSVLLSCTSFKAATSVPRTESDSTFSRPADIPFQMHSYLFPIRYLSSSSSRPYAIAASSLRSYVYTSYVYTSYVSTSYVYTSYTSIDFRPSVNPSVEPSSQPSGPLTTQPSRQPQPTTVPSSPAMWSYDFSSYTSINSRQPTPAPSSAPTSIPINTGYFAWGSYTDDACQQPYQYYLYRLGACIAEGPSFSLKYFNFFIDSMGVPGVEVAYYSDGHCQHMSWTDTQSGYGCLYSSSTLLVSSLDSLPPGIVTA